MLHWYHITKEVTSITLNQKPLNENATTFKIKIP